MRCFGKSINYNIVTIISQLHTDRCDFNKLYNYLNSVTIYYSLNANRNTEHAS